MANISVFVPTGTVPTKTDKPASLRGRSEFVIGMLDNHKHNTDKILDHLQAQLAGKFADVRFMRVKKPEAGKPAPAKLLEALADCAAVVNGIGD
jgi:hypothetical protein